MSYHLDFTMDALREIQAMHTATVCCLRFALSNLLASNYRDSES